MGRSLAGGAVVDALATTEGVPPAADAAWGIGTSLLVEAATAMLAYGVVIVLAAWLAGPTRSPSPSAPRWPRGCASPATPTADWRRSCWC